MYALPVVTAIAVVSAVFGGALVYGMRMIRFEIQVHRIRRAAYDDGAADAMQRGGVTDNPDIHLAGLTADRPGEGAFWRDLTRDLQDAEFARAYARRQRAMAAQDDARRRALALPGTSTGLDDGLPLPAVHGCTCVIGRDIAGVTNPISRCRAHRDGALHDAGMADIVPDPVESGRATTEQFISGMRARTAAFIASLTEDDTDKDTDGQSHLRRI